MSAASSASAVRPSSQLLLCAMITAVFGAWPCLAAASHSCRDDRDPQRPRRVVAKVGPSARPPCGRAVDGDAVRTISSASPCSPASRQALRLGAGTQIVFAGDDAPVTPGRRALAHRWRLVVGGRDATATSTRVEVRAGPAAHHRQQQRAGIGMNPDSRSRGCFSRRMMVSGRGGAARRCTQIKAACRRSGAPPRTGLLKREKHDAEWAKSNKQQDGAGGYHAGVVEHEDPMSLTTLAAGGTLPPCVSTQMPANDANRSSNSLPAELGFAADLRARVTVYVDDRPVVAALSVPWLERSTFEVPAPESCLLDEPVVIGRRGFAGGPGRGRRGARGERRRWLFAAGDLRCRRRHQPATPDQIPQQRRCPTAPGGPGDPRHPAHAGHARPCPGRGDGAGLLDRVAQPLALYRPSPCRSRPSRFICTRPMGLDRNVVGGPSIHVRAGAALGAFPRRRRLDARAQFRALFERKDTSSSSSTYCSWPRAAPVAGMRRQAIYSSDRRRPDVTARFVSTRSAKAEEVPVQGGARRRTRGVVSTSRYDEARRSGRPTPLHATATRGT